MKTPNVNCIVPVGNESGNSLVSSQSNVIDCSSESNSNSSEVPLSQSVNPDDEKSKMIGNDNDTDSVGGYNSEDEYSHLGMQLSDAEWDEKDRKFEKIMKKKGTGSTTSSKIDFIHNRIYYFLQVI
jgi:hypothetical protein